MENLYIKLTKNPLENYDLKIDIFKTPCSLLTIPKKTLKTDVIIQKQIDLKLKRILQYKEIQIESILKIIYLIESNVQDTSENQKEFLKFCEKLLFDFHRYKTNKSSKIGIVSKINKVIAKEVLNPFSYEKKFDQLELEIITERSDEFSISRSIEYRNLEDFSRTMDSFDKLKMDPMNNSMVYKDISEEEDLVKREILSRSLKKQSLKKMN